MNPRLLAFVCLALVPDATVGGEGAIYAKQGEDAMVVTSTMPTEKFTFRIPGAKVRYGNEGPRVWFNNGDMVLQMLLVEFDVFGAHRGDSPEVVLKKYTAWETSEVEKAFSLDRPIPSRMEKGPGSRLLSVWTFNPPKGMPTEAKSRLFMTARLNHHVFVLACPLIPGVSEKKARSFLHSVLASLQAEVEA